MNLLKHGIKGAPKQRKHSFAKRAQLQRLAPARRCHKPLMVLLGGVLMTSGLPTDVIGATARAKSWGASSAVPIQLITLKSPQLTVELTNYGARIVSIMAPDREGRRADVVLGYSSLAGYLGHPKGYFGVTVGRFGNRIAHGTFTLDGEAYHVPVNNNGNALHGGPEGFSSKVWSTSVGSDSVTFSLESPDGDMGFPGELSADVRFTLHQNRLEICYTAHTTKPTVINLTNHTYFNLAGEGNADVLREVLRINADRYTAVDATLIPSGLLPSVAHTPFDFRQAKPIGRDLHEDNQQLRFAGGYDANFVLNGKDGVMHGAAFLRDPVSGRTLRIDTTQPGLQLYSGNNLDGSVKGYSGQRYRKYGGLALEPQHFPDSPNEPTFPSTVLRPGETYTSRTMLTFGVDHRLSH